MHQKNESQHIEKYKSVLIVTRKGQLIRLNCPFLVLSRAEGQGLEAGRNYQVRQVGYHIKYKLLFLIKGRYYPVYLLEPLQ